MLSSLFRKNCLVPWPLFFVFWLILLVSSVQAGNAFPTAPDNGICPSRVLFLYNKDWTGDHPLTGSGQDSEEVARHYVRMRTDPVSGERPYLLGLTCPRGYPSPLSRDHLNERSSDNSCGVVFRDSVSGRTESACDMRDSRLVEVVLPDTGETWQAETLRLDIIPDSGTDRSPVLLVESGESLYPDQVRIQHEGDWHIRANGRYFVQGSFTAVLRCLDSQARRHEWTARYHDVNDILFSKTGPDNLRDDQNYLDCVEGPIKRFLEDPDNARPDGTLLKDHILYIVAGYGLPKTVTAPFGIAVGINEKPRDFGTYIDLGQRLQIMYLDLDRIHGFQVVPQRLEPAASSEQNAFTNYHFRTILGRPLWGEAINPFVHPKLYQRDSAKASVEPRPFNSEMRARHPGRHLYFSTRIDAGSAMEAMELVDRAVYAEKHAGPLMGIIPGIELTDDSQRTGNTESRPASLFKDLGYKHIYQHDRGWARLELYRLASGTGFFNVSDVFLPGGIATYVQSNQGWNMRNSRFHDYLRQGVTVTAGAARVSRGAPHIHNRSFWDEEIFYPFLLKGRTLGEVLLMNQIHLGWLTSFVGDPLLAFPENPAEPEDFIKLDWNDHIQVRPTRFLEFGNGFLVIADLGSSANNPRVSQMRLFPADSNAGSNEKFIFERFSSRPYVFVPRSIAAQFELWTLELIDPFGNRAAVQGKIYQD